LSSLIEPYCSTLFNEHIELYIYLGPQLFTVSVMVVKNRSGQNQNVGQDTGKHKIIWLRAEGQSNVTSNYIISMPVCAIVVFNSICQTSMHTTL